MNLATSSLPKKLQFKAGQRAVNQQAISISPLLCLRRSRYVEMLAVLFFMMVTSKEEITLSFPA
jgi:hypothetical protein